jgi:hypothetical protein
MTGKSKEIGKIRVQKSISIDLDLLQRIIEEGNEMHRDFSTTIALLVTYGLGIREAQRARDEEERKKATQGAA